MIEVTDMILDIADARVPAGLPVVGLRPVMPDDKQAVLDFVAREHQSFLEYFTTPNPGAAAFAIWSEEALIGAVLLDMSPRAAERSEDGALGCLVVADGLRGNGYGSAAIVACAERLAAEGRRRVIAEWVASVSLYERLGFRVWRTRTIDADA